MNRFNGSLAEERLDASSTSPHTSGETDAVLSSSRSKRAGYKYKMNRFNRGLHMLRLGKRADDLATDESGLSASPEFVEYLLKHYHPFVYPNGYAAEDDENLDDLVDAVSEVYNAQDPEFFSDDDNDVIDEGLEQRLRFRRSESDAPEDSDDLAASKRQDEENNDDFTVDGQWSSYGDDMGLDDAGLDKRQLNMLRLGKRPMQMLRLGKRPMKMLRLGKRPMQMLRLGKRPMNMLRLGKRPMNMLRLGKRPMNMLRLGKRPMGMLRLGKRQMKMLRLGKRPMNMLRLGKRPMGMLRLGKRQMKMLRLGKRSTETEESAENSASA
ncbi:myomodulin neuropeptides [Elysia marginata]|uniref:Myomodulin neuropeptides n=1 Tax=Elysia marginata TaxID=1093978 RepID=A0AAV4FRT8_9GAST|nr:myomodulin neuropeptides [Elysia marginata]